MTLGEKILQLRKASGLSQQQLADECGVSRQSISKWELNDSNPDISKLVILSNLFSVSLDDLIKERSDTSNKSTNNSNIDSIIRLNNANKTTHTGIFTIILSLVLLIAEYLFLPLFGRMQKAQTSGSGFYSDFIKYAKVEPMPTVFLITKLILLIGVFLVIKGYLLKKENLKIKLPFSIKK